MPDTLGVPGFDELSRQWLALAERRLAYFSELYRSGRWQRYYTAESFADQVVDVMKGGDGLAGTGQAGAGFNGR